MSRITLFFTFIFLFGCDSRAETGVNIPDQTTTSKQIASDVKDVTDKHAPKWVIDYTGDMTGTIQGVIMAAMALPSATKVTGMAMTKDMKGKAPEAFMLTVLTVATPPTATMALTLADGTKCKDAGISTVKIIDGEAKTFRAEAAGTLLCGDRKISYKAKMSKNP